MMHHHRPVLPGHGRSVVLRRIVDNHELVNWVRLIKSEAEVAYMREAGEICTRAMNRAARLRTMTITMRVSAPAQARAM